MFETLLIARKDLQSPNPETPEVPVAGSNMKDPESVETLGVRGLGLISKIYI